MKALSPSQREFLHKVVGYAYVESCVQRMLDRIRNVPRSELGHDGQIFDQYYDEVKHHVTMDLLQQCIDHMYHLIQLEPTTQSREYVHTLHQLSVDEALQLWQEWTEVTDPSMKGLVIVLCRRLKIYWYSAIPKDLTDWFIHAIDES